MRISGVLVRGPLGIGSAGIRILSPLDASHVIAALPSRWSRTSRLLAGWPRGCQRRICLPSSCCLFLRRTAFRSLTWSNGRHTDRPNDRDRPVRYRPRAPSTSACRRWPPLPLLMMIDLGLASAPSTPSSASASDLSDCLLSGSPSTRSGSATT